MARQAVAALTKFATSGGHARQISIGAISERIEELVDMVADGGHPMIPRSARWKTWTA